MNVHLTLESSREILGYRGNFGNSVQAKFCSYWNMEEKSLDRSDINLITVKFFRLDFIKTLFSYIVIYYIHVCKEVECGKKIVDKQNITDKYIIL